MLLLKKISLMLIYFLRERERERETDQVGEGQRERETQNPRQAPGSELSAESDAGLEHTNCEIMT